MNNTTKTAVNAIRALSIEAIQKAKSGHPGLPLGAAPIVYELFAKQMRHDPSDPSYVDRDRFVLSAGHGSALLYSALHLFGYEVTIEDLKNFRQVGAITTGHPEWKVCPGVETSTGPLGQGIANAVGFAIAETMLAAKYNKKDCKIVDHYTYALTGDGCLQEGIAYEAASLAGALKLGKLILLYDKNDITIEGNISLTFSEDVGKVHEAMGWQVLYVDEADCDKIGKAIEQAKAETEKPSLIIIKTQIGYGSPKAGSASCHGSPLGEEGVIETKKNLGFDYPDFTVPDFVTEHYAAIKAKLVKEHEEYEKKLAEYAAKYPSEYKQFAKDISGEVNIDEAALYEFEDKPVATRKASNIVLNKIADMMSTLVGGSADLGPSNLTMLKDKADYSANDRSGRYIHFGIREHAMAAIANGMYLHGGVRPYVSTFFAFSDYMKNAIRMSALMKLPILYIFTHDSIGVGEDGPTHQPIEHLTGLRSMPDLDVYRPADARETAAAYISAIKGENPTCIVCSRQDLPQLAGSGEAALKGGYVISDMQGYEAIIVSAGSEVSVAIDAQTLLADKGIKTRVVSMPCFSVFERQSEQYKESVLPSSVKARVAVEAGSSMCWYKYANETVCIDRFGQSGPAKKLFEIYGITAANVADKVIKVLKK